MNDDSRTPPDRLPPLERIGWLVAGSMIGEDPCGCCIDCGRPRESDGVTEHHDHCGLAAALVAYYDFRRDERTPAPGGPGWDPETRLPKPGAVWECWKGKRIQCGDCTTPGQCRWVLRNADSDAEDAR